jgi:hypothetical protein
MCSFISLKFNARDVVWDGSRIPAMYNRWRKNPKRKLSHQNACAKWENFPSTRNGSLSTTELLHSKHFGRELNEIYYNLVILCFFLYILSSFSALVRGVIVIRHKILSLFYSTSRQLPLSVARKTQIQFTNSQIFGIKPILSPSEGKLGYSRSQFWKFLMKFTLTFLTHVYARFTQKWEILYVLRWTVFGYKWVWSCWDAVGIGRLIVGWKEAWEDSVVDEDDGGKFWKSEGF